MCNSETKLNKKQSLIIESKIKRINLTVYLLGGTITEKNSVIFSHIQAILWTPAGCPTIQLNFDTNYLEIASDPTG